MPHKNECCFSCKHAYSGHGDYKCQVSGCKCTNFEFIAASKRDHSNIVFEQPFKSKSSPKTYMTTFWHYGDYSCNCMGWRTHRICEHIKKLIANGNRPLGGSTNIAYENEHAPVANIVTNMAGKLDDLEKGKGNVSFTDVQAEIEYNSAVLAGAADTLARRLEEAKRKILGGSIEPEKKPEPEKKILNADDPFGD